MGGKVRANFAYTDSGRGLPSAGSVARARAGVAAGGEQGSCVALSLSYAFVKCWPWAEGEDPASGRDAGPPEPGHWNTDVLSSKAPGLF